MGDRSRAGGFYKDRVYSEEGLPELIGLMRGNDHLVLDIGCGGGANARLMKELGKIVHAITLSEAEAEVVSPHVKRVLIGDIETMAFNYADGFFDAIVLSHVLEHLIDPWKTLARLRKLLRLGGRIYVALPNITFYQERFKFLLGRFEYNDTGIMDRFHLRFFTYKTAQELVRLGGYQVLLAKTIGSFPLWPLRCLVGGPIWIDRLACLVFPNLFGRHVIIVGETVLESEVPTKTEQRQVGPSVKS